jgi:hypothetical protein
MEVTAIVLAKGAPNRCRDGSTSMCAIAVSQQIGLFRMYPLSIKRDDEISVWTELKVSLAGSNTDQRKESFKLVDYEIIGRIDDRQTKRDLLNDCILKSGEQDPIDYQNMLRRSIAIVKSDGPVGASLIPRERCDVIAGTDEDGFATTQAEFPFKPYIEWTSIQGKSHRTHLVGQEVYMGMLRNASTPFHIFDNLHIGDQDYEHWLILGNMKDRRTVWVAAHLHRQKKIAQQPIFSSSAITDGIQSGWPYETQEATNAKSAGPQMEFSFTT